MKMSYLNFFFRARARQMTCAVALAGVVLSGSNAFAGIVSVVETGGDNEATDTIPAQWTGQTFPISIANEPIPGAAIGGTYTVGTFAHQAPAFVDRNHRYVDDVGLPLPSYLLGSEYILSGNDNRDNVPYTLDVTVDTPSLVFMLIDNRLQDTNNANPPTFGVGKMQWILDEGWIPFSTGQNRTLDFNLPDEVAFDEGADGTINQWYSVYLKSMDAPGTIRLSQADNAGQNMYGVVVQEIVPEPASCLALLAGLAGLAVRRRRA